jgi:hypothetical protein
MSLENKEEIFRPSDSLPLTAERNYSITVTPLISLAQGIPAKLTTSPSPDDFFPNLVKSPLFIAIICAVSAIFFIIVGAVVFQCFRSPLPPHKRCYRYLSNFIYS